MKNFYTRKILDLYVLKTFSKIKQSFDKIDKSDDSIEDKNMKKKFLLAISKCGFKLYNDSQDYKNGKLFQQLSEETRIIVNKELGLLLEKCTSMIEILSLIQRESKKAKDILIL